MQSDGFFNKLLKRLGHQLIAMGSPKADSAPIDYRWGEPATEEEAVDYLVARVRTTADKGQKSLIYLLGEQSDFTTAVKSRLEQDFKLKISQVGNVEEITEMPSDTLSDSLIAIACPSAKSAHDFSMELLKNPFTESIPVEYVVVPHLENSDINRSWETANGHISPLYIQKEKPFRIYQDSLERFEAKTGMRDYMDLLQCVNHIHRRNIPGDLCEFGSFKGHSGYLTRKYLDEIQSDRTLFLFDMFESFPAESIGVDHFWNETHDVDFEDVKSKFSDLTKVEFIKGEFSKTLPESPCDTVALAFVDCDAYRSTKYLIEEIFDKRLSTGGIMIFEDYGHANLLGNRLAVHECFETRRNAFCFFSHFSGCYIASKIS
jgi:hypothetical protein